MLRSIYADAVRLVLAVDLLRSARARNTFVQQLATFGELKPVDVCAVSMQTVMSLGHNIFHS